jgi:Na+/H+-translocating membrane pyrophosphatase
MLLDVIGTRHDISMNYTFSHICSMLLAQLERRVLFMISLFIMLIVIVTGVICGVFEYREDSSKNIRDALLVGFAVAILWPFVFVIAIMLWYNERFQQKL